MPDTEELIARMEARGASLRSLGYRVLFELEEGDMVLLDATDGKAEVRRAAPGEAADTVLRLSAANLDKLIAGKLSPMLAFSTGRLKVEGSKGVAMKLASLLDED